VLALLPLGTSVRWIAMSEGSTFCEVDVAGTRGFVACRFLSASAPTVPSAGANGGATGARWVTGAGVILRAEPTTASAIVARLPLNARVELLSPAAGSPYCEVATGVPGAASARGYAACRYLATTPLAVDRIVTPLLPGGQPNPSYEPVRAFWLAPSWARLEAYGVQLGESLNARTDTPTHQPTPPERPADAELDRMKAYLAKGIYVPMPAPPPRWDDVRRLARADAYGQLSGVLALGNPPFDTAQSGAARLVGLDSALELPAIRTSLFRQASELAPPGESVEGLSGRFHIAHAYRTGGRELGGELGTVDGVWDIGRVTVALTQPVVRTTVFPDGRLRSSIVRPSDTRILSGATDAPMCDGFATAPPTPPSGATSAPTSSRTPRSRSGIPRERCSGSRRAMRCPRTKRLPSSRAIRSSASGPASCAALGCTSTSTRTASSTSRSGKVPARVRGT
jgi:hypothetical protein